MVIQHNLAAINNINVGNRVQKGKFKATERLSSGYRINRAADDAAGLAISEKMRSRMRALFQVQNNIEDGISLTQTADGALAEVNDMLNRVQELCVQAANGTNTEEDRMMLADEITQLYDAMEAVFTDTEFNTIPIFRHDGANFYAGRPRYNYTETVSWLPEGQYASWGDELLGITDKVFDKSKNAVAATATILLDDTIDTSKASTFVGKNLQVGNCVFQFISKGNGDRTGYIKTENSKTYINVDTDGRTVQEVLNRLVSDYNSYGRTGKIETASIIKASGGKNALKIVMKKTDLTPSCTIDGVTIQYPAISGGNGSTGNNVVISSKEEAPIEKVDTAENPLFFDSYATAKFDLLKGNDDDVISPEDFTGLQNNTFSIRIGSTTEQIRVGDLIRDDMTRAEARAAFVDALNGVGNGVTASLSGSEVRITVASGSATEMVNLYIGESVQPSVEIYSDDTHSLPISLDNPIKSTPESVDVWTLKLEDNAVLDYPVTCKVGGEYFTIFDKGELHSGSNYISVSGSRVELDNPDEDKVLQQLASFLSRKLSNVTVTKNGDTITIKNKIANSDLELDKKITGDTVPYTEKAQYKSVIGTKYFNQGYSVSMDLKECIPSAADVSRMYGRGFVFNGVSYEFSDASSELIAKDSVRIDISRCDSYEAIAQKVQTVLGTKYTVTDSSGILTIAGTKQTSGGSIALSAFSDGRDGADGLMNNEEGLISVTTSGGKNMTRPQTAINYSGVNLDNISELYGKGFRITCATCPGEFVNVIFCHDKESANFPSEFEYTDENGNKNQIKNHVVELKNITSGNQIVDSIAQQLQGSLEHTITVEPDGASLLVMDKRYGDILDKDTGDELQAKILAGVYTNCTYHVDAERIVDDSELVGDGRADTNAYYSFVMIYAGDTEEKPYIPIHLPYLSLEHLKLDYPGDSFQTYDGVTKVMRQSKTAASVISMARSNIGADQNRLEHAFQYAANAEEQVTASYSRIRDADMAEESVNQAKYNILAEVQRAMLSQITRQPEQVLSLLR